LLAASVVVGIHCSVKKKRLRSLDVPAAHADFFFLSEAVKKKLLSDAFKPHSEGRASSRCPFTTSGAGLYKRSIA
jgi:hypothetical protein